MRKINKIIIHCTATAEGKNYNAADIDRWHKTMGFSKIGYHYIILLDGTVELGRPLAEKGAHTSGHNSDSIGICYVGGLDNCGNPKDTRTSAQRTALEELVKKLKKRFPDANIHGHRDFANKDCPCFDVKTELYTNNNSA